MPYPTQVVLSHNQTEETDGDSPPAVLDRRNGHTPRPANPRSDAISSKRELWLGLLSSLVADGGGGTA